jgi:hypothetical protein
VSDIDSVGDWWLRWGGGSSRSAVVVDRCLVGLDVSWVGAAVVALSVVV